MPITITPHFAVTLSMEIERSGQYSCCFVIGQYAVTPGRNEPCLFYVDFEDNIYVYYNLYIQTKPALQFRDVLNSDVALVSSTTKMRLIEV